MRNLILISLYSFTLLILSCDYFDKEKATEIVKLSKNDLQLYQEFYDLIIRDSAQIRKIMKPIYGTTNSTSVTTSSDDLFKIDSLSYYRIINELKEKEIFSDFGIVCCTNGMVIFRLKDMWQNKWADYNDSYIHLLIFNGKQKEYFYNYDKIVIDSTITENIRYVFFTAKTGH